MAILLLKLVVICVVFSLVLERMFGKGWRAAAWSPPKRWRLMRRKLKKINVRALLPSSPWSTHLLNKVERDTIVCNWQMYGLASGILGGFPMCMLGIILGNVYPYVPIAYGIPIMIIPTVLGPVICMIGCRIELKKKEQSKIFKAGRLRKAMS